MRDAASSMANGIPFMGWQIYTIRGRIVVSATEKRDETLVGAFDE